METRADHLMLNTLAVQSGGKMFYPGRLSQLAKSIKADESIKPVIYNQNEVKELLNLKWLFFIILGMLGMEWMIRKWNGFI
jgi:hypothetical protein